MCHPTGCLRPRHRRQGSPSDQGARVVIKGKSDKLPGAPPQFVERLATKAHLILKAMSIRLPIVLGIFGLSLLAVSGCTSEDKGVDVGDAHQEPVGDKDASQDDQRGPLDGASIETEASTNDSMGGDAGNNDVGPGGTVGPPGGTVRTASGAAVIVPPAALTTEVEISIQTVSAPISIAGGTVAGKAVLLGPEGQKFDTPVKLEIPFDLTLLSPGTDPARLVLAIAPANSNDFSWMETTLDPARGLLLAQTAHFSTVVPFLPNAGDAGAPLFITTSSPLPVGTIGVNYDVTLTAQGGSPPYGWIVSSGALPDGLTLSPGGELAGIPTADMTNVFTIRVSDSQQLKLEKPFSLSVARPSNPAPLLGSLNPAHVVAGSPSLTLHLDGDQFIASSLVYWNGTLLPKSFLSSTSLQAVVDASLLVNAGAVTVTVQNPPPGGGRSQLTFIVDAPPSNPFPTVQNVSPSTIAAGAIDTQISLQGTGFVSGVSQVFAGSSALATLFVSSSQLDAVVPAPMLAASGSIFVHVVNSPPGGGTSNDLEIVVREVGDAGPADKGILTWGGDTQYRFTSVYRAAVDKNGATYLAGVFNESIDFDPGPGTYPVSQTGSNAGYVMKLAPDHQFSSVWTFGSASPTVIYTYTTTNGVAVDGDGSVYVSGWIYPDTSIRIRANTTIIDLPLSASSSIFVTKFNATGDLLWARTWSVGNNNVIRSAGVVLDPGGNVYTAGVYADLVDFDPSSGVDIRNPASDGSAFLLSLTPSGDFRWVRTFGGKWTEVRALTSDLAGNVFVTGTAETTGDFDPGPGVVTHTTQSLDDVFTSKFGSNGSHAWTRFIAGSENSTSSYGAAIAGDAGGGAYVTGMFNGQYEFDGLTGSDVHTASGGLDAFLVRYDSNGTYAWGKHWGADGDDDSAAVTADPAFGVVVMGHFHGTVDFDPGPSVVALAGPAFDLNRPTGDIFVSAFDPTGEFRWVVDPGRGGGAEGAALLVDPLHGLNVASNFFGTADFDPGPGLLQRTAPFSHAFLWNLDRDGLLAP